MSDPLDPKASPGKLAAAGVRRVNNLPLYIVAAVGLIFLGVIAMEASDRAARQNAPAKAAAEAPAQGASALADALVSDVPNGIIPADAVASPPLDAEAIADGGPPVPVLRPDDAALASAGGNVGAPNTRLSKQRLDPPTRSPELDQVRQQKLQRLEEAARAGTKVAVELDYHTGAGAPGLSADPPTSPLAAASQLAAVRQQLAAADQSDAEAVYAARLAALQGSGLAADVPPTSAPRNALARFDAKGAEDRWALDAKPAAPRSRYELRAGFVVPAIMISGINSDLPGQLVAQVAQDVFDTATGQHVLIPQGSRLVGSYESDVAFGQSRIFVVWQRIVFPDGKAMDIGAMPGGDAAGYAGLQDRANNHYARLFGSAFLMSGVTAGITLSQDRNQSTGQGVQQQTASGALSEALGQQLGQVTAQLIGKNINRSPTLEVRPGYRLNVIVTKDLTFDSSYSAFDYQRG